MRSSAEPHASSGAQGVAIIAEKKDFLSLPAGPVEALSQIEHGSQSSRTKIYVVLDEVWDPHNMGAILRTSTFLVSGPLYHAVTFYVWLPHKTGSSYVSDALYSFFSFSFVQGVTGLITTSTNSAPLSSAVSQQA